MRIEHVGQAGLGDWARVKFQAFADQEGEPSAGELTTEVAACTQEVFLLGTRVPSRHQSISQSLYRRLGFRDEVYWYQRFDLTTP